MSKTPLNEENKELEIAQVTEEAKETTEEVTEATDKKSKTELN